jgi:Aspartyl/Asparaginyl beta-hydroxylase
MDDHVRAEMEEFCNRWLNHIPSIPVIEDPKVKAIRNALGYLPMRFPFEVPHAEMCLEAENLRDMFVAHRAAGNHGGWLSLCVHGIGATHTENHDRYGFSNRDDAGYHWTEISSSCPVTTEFFRDTFKYTQYDRIRYMLLEPDGFILPHADVEWKQLSAVNIALNNPDKCYFVMENWGIVPFSPGSVNMLAVGNKHVVWNRSLEPRYHMIAHGIKDDAAWNQWIVDSYKDLVAANAR